MGRKNHKGRGPRQHPRRRYQPGRHQRDARTKTPTYSDDESTASANSRASIYTDYDIIETPPTLPPPLVSTCGTCREWEPGPDPWAAGGRGCCLHPASGITFPPSDAPACPFYDR